MIKVATDAGGTFTDLVAFDEATGAVFVGKALTTPADPSIGVVDTIHQGVGTGLAAERVSLFVHGGTTAINAITERKGVRTALVTTKGFRDVIAIGRGNRPDLYNLHSLPSEPFVPRHLRFEVEERMDAKGRVRAPLSLDDLDGVAERIEAAGGEAVAIAFLHAYANPEHEIAAARRLAARLPGVAITASHTVSRQWREFERSNTAVLSAYVQPIMTRYLRNLDAALKGEGFDSPRYCMQSNGGLATFGDATASPLSLVESGPSGGVAGAVRIGEAIGESDILYFDVGGTTAKCSLVRDGQPVLRPDYKLEWTRLKQGYPVQVPVVDIVEIGAGGGSIARLTESGDLTVGPQSAGADPGPACYGRGGTAPTVTDAKLITGVIDPENFAGRRLRLDPELSRRAFEALAAQLSISIVEAAHAVIGLAEANMINALKLVTIQRGHDPRDLTLIATGGGGPMHAASLGRELGVKHVLVPRHAGLFSAWGMLAARPRIDLHRTRLSTLTAETFPVAAEIFVELEAEAGGLFGIAPEALLRTRSIEMRYAGQEHAISTRFEPLASLEDLLAAFHATHERAYTFRLDDAAVELVTFHLAAEIDAPRIGLTEMEPKGDAADALIGYRALHDSGPTEARAPVYERERLPAGACLVGPALIEEPTTTTLVLQGQRVSVDSYGLLWIEEIG
jgi:N-methylhydantoinase A